MKDRASLNINKSTVPQRIFIIGVLVLISYTLITLIPTGGNSLFCLLHTNTYDTFMDFFNSIFDSNFDNPYVERQNIYPAICFLYYKLCGTVLTPEVASAFDWRNSRNGLMLVVFVLFLSIFILYKLIKPQVSHSIWDKMFPLLLLTATVPFLYCYERANIILQVALLLFVFIKYQNSENKFLKELGLICLALAAAIKIYPAVFGLLLIKNKQWKEAFRCIIYGAALFFVPFYFYGGISSIITLLKNATNTGDMFATWGFGYKVNIGNTLDFMEAFLGTEFNVLRIVLVAFIGICSICVLIFSKDMWKVQAALAAVIILIPGFSYTYTLIYMAIPLVTFFYSRSNKKYIDWIYMVLFVCLFAPFSFGGSDPFKLQQQVFYPLGLTTLISSFTMIFLLSLLAFDSVYSFFKCKEITKA